MFILVLYSMVKLMISIYLQLVEHDGLLHTYQHLLRLVLKTVMILKRCMISQVVI